MNKRLSILIPTLYERKESLRTLLENLSLQETKDIEILTWIDNRRLSIGAKRNILLGMAKGDFVAFVDDDDLVSDDYIEKILAGIETNPDCCSLQGEISQTVNRGKINQARVTRVFKHSIEYETWFRDKNIYYRCPNHLNAIKRDLALQVGFPETNKGEDRDFSLKIQPILKTEAKIKGTIYYYFAS